MSTTRTAPERPAEGAAAAAPRGAVVALVLATLGFAVNFWAWGQLMTASTLLFQAHVMSAWLLFAVWPFTRLVHVFSAPLGYLTRPYIPYRSRENAAGSRAVKPGWEPVGSGRKR